MTLAEVLLAARGRHPAFVRELVPDATLARYLTGYQRELVSKALQVDRSYLAQQMSVAFAVDAALVGAGNGQRPVVGTAAVSLPMGSAVEVPLDADSQLEAEAVASGGSPTTLSRAGAGWTTDEWLGKTVALLTGTGTGQRRTIASNTATVLTVTQDWDEDPDDTTTFAIYEAVTTATDTYGVVVGESFTATRVAYGIRVDATGTAYLDYTLPLQSTYDVGIPLPPHHYLLGGTARLSDPMDAVDLTIVDWADYRSPPGDYAVSVMGQTLYLAGTSHDWTGVTALDLRYVPVAPALTRLSDTFLVPDTAYQPLVDGAAWHAALRASGVADAIGGQAVQAMAAQKAESERTFLREVSAARRGRVAVIREWEG